MGQSPPLWLPPSPGYFLKPGSPRALCHLPRRGLCPQCVWPTQGLPAFWAEHTSCLWTVLCRSHLFWSRLLLAKGVQVDGRKLWCPNRPLAAFRLLLEPTVDGEGRRFGRMTQLGLAGLGCSEAANVLRLFGISFPSSKGSCKAFSLPGETSLLKNPRRMLSWTWDFLPFAPKRT